MKTIVSYKRQNSTKSFSKAVWFASVNALVLTYRVRETSPAVRRVAIADLDWVRIDVVPKSW